MYSCKYFKIEELVPKNIARKYGERAWQFLDERALITLDILREKFGKIKINDYLFGGSNQYRGFRPPNCTIGADLSQHRFGRAFDCIFLEVDVEVVRTFILENPDEFSFINALELDVSWLHFDTRNCKRTMTFKP
ncbi:MAG: hypothetical protein K8S23_08125 [Candidatus Cloacimonetes bacterium]|nr:hypothetical protein [Candidatus Cloacimonadota bacterium]